MANTTPTVVTVTRQACFAPNGLWAQVTKSGKVVGITYVPRTPNKDGERAPKCMNVRANYDKYLAGGEAPYDYVGKGLIPVCDNNALIKGLRMVASGQADKVRCIRSFGKEGLLEVRAGGTVYVIVDCLESDDCDCNDCVEAQLPDAYDLANHRYVPTNRVGAQAPTHYPERNTDVYNTSPQVHHCLHTGHKRR